MDESKANAGASAPIAITVCIIAHNEAERLPECLASVGFCDEIVLVDSGSTDATIQVARAAGARVVEESWRGFAGQRNVALDHARGDWILEIDADERVTQRLRTEIESFVASPPPDVDLCGLPLREMFLGRALGPSGKYPKYRHRFFRRGAYRHDENRTVHEGLVPHGRVHPFEGDLLHLLATSSREALEDAWSYSGLEAGQLHAPRTPRALLTGALLRPSVKFGYRLAVDGGWRDGWEGAVKIAIDCTTDAVVWLRYITGFHGHQRGNSGVDATLHYGARKARRGSVRIVAIAADRAAGERAMSWLAAAATAGVDTALVTATDHVMAVSDSSAARSAVRVRSLERLGPLALIRALDAEEQLRTLDAVIPFGRRARLLLRAVPPGLRGHMRELSADADPGTIRREAGQQAKATTA